MRTLLVIEVVVHSRAIFPYSYYTNHSVIVTTYHVAVATIDVCGVFDSCRYFNSCDSLEKIPRTIK